MSKGSIEWEYDENEGLVLRFKPWPGDKVVAGEVLQHAMTANKELLLTMRSLIDVVVKRMEKKETRTNKRGTKIKVE